MRAPKKCGHATCEVRVTGRAYCPEHTRNFRTSTRSARLPRDWQAIRAQVKARAKGRCEAIRHHPDCDGIGRECDHITPGDDHRLTNLQWLSTPCHLAKTRAESAARNRARHAQRDRGHA